MSLGLPRKNSLLSDHLVSEDGTLRPDTELYEYYTNLIKATGQQRYKDGYNAGVEFVLTDMTNRLDKLVRMHIEDYNNLVPLPDYAKNLQQIMDGLCIYVEALKSQINNKNPNNFKDGSRMAVLRAERCCGQDRGSFINSLISKNEAKYKTHAELNEGARKKAMEAKAVIRAKKLKEQENKEYNNDPTDILKNN